MSDERAYEEFIVFEYKQLGKATLVSNVPIFSHILSKTPILSCENNNAPWQTAWTLLSQVVSDMIASSGRRNKIGRFPQFYASPKEVGPTHPARSTAQVEIAVIGQNRKGGRPNDLHGGLDPTRVGADLAQ